MSYWYINFTVISSILPFVFKNGVHDKYSKILMYFLGFGPCFVILSISVEGLFFVSYSIALMAWVQVESLLRSSVNIGKRSGKSMTTKDRRLGQATAYNLQMDDLRIALFFLFFVQVGFLGTGKYVTVAFGIWRQSLNHCVLQRGIDFVQSLHLTAEL